jgi:hypothetical protein
MWMRSTCAVGLALGLGPFILPGCGSANAPGAADQGETSGDADVDVTADAGAFDVRQLPDEASARDAGFAHNEDAGENDAWEEMPTLCSPFITNVIHVDYGAGAGFGQGSFPAVVEGPPKGGGCCKGSLNVLSLGDGGSIVVEFGQTIVDGPGPDFIVFENAFDIGGDPKNPYADPASVEVSADGANWVGFPCTASAYPWGACAGWHPVFANPDVNAIDPLDPATAGGDAFDLADLPSDAGVTDVRYVRIVDRPDIPGDFDLDAIGVVHGRCR